MKLFKKIQEKVNPPVRPIAGYIHRENGEDISVNFHRSEDDPNVFTIHAADSNDQVELNDGDSLSVDILGPGQSISVTYATEDKK